MQVCSLETDPVAIHAQKNINSIQKICEHTWQYQINVVWMYGWWIDEVQLLCNAAGSFCFENSFTIGN